MGCVSYCDVSLLEHNLVECNEYKLGGVSAIIVGACNVTVANPENEQKYKAT
jgi:hypothetical protein